MKKLFSEIPEGKGECPRCSGTGRARTSEGLLPYRSTLRGYDPMTQTLPCRNCGGQRMYGAPTGLTNLRSDGTPCLHEYSATHPRNTRTYTVYRCTHCPETYDIDSGD